MGAKTGIEWCDATWNPWTGCTKVSAGCEHCYMYRQKTRWGHDPSKVVRSAAKTFNLLLAKKRDGSWKIPSGSFVFVCSWSDFCHPDVDDAWINQAWAMMRARSDCVFLILTKRVERLHHEANLWWPLREQMGHIWLGVTAENQEMVDERIPKLLEIDWPGKTFVSVEPMLGPVELSAWLPCPSCRGRGWYLPYFSANHAVPCEKCQKHARDKGVYLPTDTYARPGPRLDWIISGGESGPNNREVKLDWVRNLRDQCIAAEVPFFLKQYSGVRPAHMPELDGKVWDQRPKPSAAPTLGSP